MADGRAEGGAVLPLPLLVSVQQRGIGVRPRAARSYFRAGVYPEYERSGDVYVNAAAQASREGMLPWDSLCSAAEAYVRAQDADKLLDAARSCIDKAARIEGTSDRIAKAHFIIADTLNRRGVYEEGLAHANEAVALDSSDAFYYDARADSLIGLRRFEDAILGQQRVRPTVRW